MPDGNSPRPVGLQPVSIQIDAGTLCLERSETPTSVGNPPSSAISAAGSRSNQGAAGAPDKPPQKKDISQAVAQAIVTEAATWKGTPYALVGADSKKGVGGDCSGSTQKIYYSASCPYAYQTSGAFPDYALASGLFRELGASEQRQDGDILSWPNHMAIYCTFANDPDNATTERVNKKGQQWTQNNDIWTASKPGGPPYGPAQLRWWRPDAPRVFRYLK